MSVHRIASRYAKSLIELAIEQKTLEEVTTDVETFREYLKNRDLYLLLKSPIVNADKKQDILDMIFEDKFGELFMAFLRILVRKGREPYLPEIAAEYIEQYKNVKQISTVKLTTANEISEDLKKAIHEKLTKSGTTEKNVELITAVDPSLIGGFVLEYEDKLYDASISNKLGDLKKNFRDNLYISKILAV